MGLSVSPGELKTETVEEFISISDGQVRTPMQPSVLHALYCNLLYCAALYCTVLQCTAADTALHSTARQMCLMRESRAPTMRTASGVL